MSRPPTDGRRIAREVADAVLYEGYVLFPYRATALKNRYRWQWGVVAPTGHPEVGPATVSCDLLLQATPAATAEVTLRFLHLRRRQLFDAQGQAVADLPGGAGPLFSWDEGIEQEIGTGPILLSELPVTRPVDLPGALTREQQPDGSVVEHRVEPLQALVSVTAQLCAPRVVRLRATIVNRSAWSEDAPHRDEVLRRSLIGTHLIAESEGGRFASLIDPPAWAAPHASACENRVLHPVLVGAPGTDDAVLAAPIILYDHPTVAAESAGPTYDATEVDELLALCVFGLSDEERTAAQATDPRAAELVERTAALPSAVIERLHGAVRSLGPPPEVDPDLAATLGIGEAPAGSVRVQGGTAHVGDAVRLRPNRRADAQDLFNAGMRAVVERIVTTVEGETFVAVTLEGDPAADLNRLRGVFQYFALDEVVLDP